MGAAGMYDPAALLLEEILEENQDVMFEGIW